MTLRFTSLTNKRGHYSVWILNSFFLKLHVPTPKCETQSCWRINSPTQQEPRACIQIISHMHIHKAIQPVLISINSSNVSGQIPTKYCTCLTSWENRQKTTEVQEGETNCQNPLPGICLLGCWCKKYCCHVHGRFKWQIRATSKVGSIWE